MKLKRIMALAGAILLAGLFIAAIVLAVTGAPKEQLMAVFFSIVFLSVLFYAIGLMTRILKNSRNTPKDHKLMDRKGGFQHPKD